MLFALEGLGIAERGTAGQLMASGAVTPGGTLPINTHGGLLCEGYLHGMNTVAEAALQIQGRGGRRQVDGAETVSSPLGRSKTDPPLSSRGR